MHKWRIPGVDLAVVDVAATMAVALLTWRATGMSCYMTHLVGWIVAGIAAHWLFCVPTKLNKNLGL